MKPWLFIPLGAFFCLVVVLGVGFTLEDPHKLPSVLIDRPFPEFELPALGAEAVPLNRSSVVGEVALVNIWATWCAACLVEHPVLLRLAREEGLRIIGVNYNDQPDKAAAWLRRHEDPYELVIIDQEGQLGIDLGIYGAPETFVVDATGTIRFRHVGAVTETVWADTLGPIVAVLRAGHGS
ncbi:MAG: DsbE family thiol:disulfide interchange protein [Gammaproteobacteria bacterium]|nr:DsbE family thiol:disulfide interchange protein [Gammaproteobacteria bacterium]